VDGSHIQVLLLTLFFRHFPKLIEAGHICMARRRCSAWTPARGKKPARSSMRWTRRARRHLDKCAKEGAAREMPGQPLQGPGRDECRAAVGNHAEPRHASPAAGAVHESGLCTVGGGHQLMGKGEAAARRELMELHGDAVEVDI
jgi:topoisomerase-4 subunit B